MRKILPFIFVIPVFYFSCTKSNTGNIAISGKYMLISDTLSSSIGCCNGITSNYTGVAGDYWDFSSDGKLYTREHTTLDTLSYTKNSDNTITISTSAGSYPEDTIFYDAQKHLVLQSKPFISPGGNFYHRVTLEK